MDQADPPSSLAESDDTLALASEEYAIDLATTSYDWYKARAIFCRRAFWVSESLLLMVTSSIPVAVAVAPSVPAIPAVLGAVAVVLAGLRAIYNWQDNYLRYSRAREQIDAERRFFAMRAGVYKDSKIAAIELVRNVTNIEQGEMKAWLSIAKAPSSSG